MSSVLVTGGMGVIGSCVIRKLLGQATKVVTYDNRADTALVKDIVEKFDCVVGDVLDLPNLIHTIKRYAVKRVIHLAAVLPDQAEANPLVGFRINAEGSLNVLEAARLMGIKRVVYASSKAVYDITRGEHAHPVYAPIDEDYPKRPHSVYGTTKLFVENLGLDYNRVYGLDFVALRFATPYGIGRQVRHGVRGITSKIIESAMLGKPLEIPQGGDQKDDFIYVRDVATGVVLACFAENLGHRIFHLGTGRGETLQHIIEILDKIFGEVPIKIGPGLNFLGSKAPLYSVFNIDRAREELGFTPQYDLEAGVRDYIENMKHLDIRPILLS